jgi:hypothetical protein
MARKGGNPELKKHQFKKGHSKMGGMKTGQKTTKVILREFMERDVEEFFIPPLKDVDGGERAINKFNSYQKALKVRGITTVKEAIIFKATQQAYIGDRQAREWVNKNIGEEAGVKIEHSGEMAIDINNIDFSKLTKEQIRAIADGKITRDQLTELVSTQSKG